MFLVQRLCCPRHRSCPVVPLKSNRELTQVSEHSLWSSMFYSRLIAECLRVANAPADLVQVISIIVGMSETSCAPMVQHRFHGWLTVSSSVCLQVIGGDGVTGAALTRHVDMMTFVGSTKARDRLEYDRMAIINGPCTWL